MTIPVTTAGNECLFSVLKRENDKKGEKFQFVMQENTDLEFKFNEPEIVLRPRALLEPIWVDYRGPQIP